MADNGLLVDGLVWLPDPHQTFVKGRIIETINDGKQVKVRPENSQEDPIILDIDKIDRCNPPHFDKCQDMASMTYLSEPSVVNNLMLRYKEDSIYTCSGLFLVAINPYKELNIYDKSFISMYKDSRSNKSDSSEKDKKLTSCKPHIFAISEEAFQNLITDGKDQSVLVTGESGAGKTETTKKVIQYLLAVVSTDKDNSTPSSFESQILEANPILESFGNAQTVKNLNSSRFGKFIKIHIQHSTRRLVGAHIDWYLLEKSRVVLQDKKERNYHVFYQFLKSAPESELKKLRLTRSVQQYGYLKDTNYAVAGIDDKEEYLRLQKALEVMNFSKEEKRDIFKVIATILHLGNLTFRNRSQDDRQASFSDDAPLSIVSELLGVSENDIRTALLTSKVKAGREFVTQQRTASQAKFAIDALSKSLYERLFQFLVDKINDNFSRNSLLSMEAQNFVGILDIAGFEIFERNSFEQLCINYTNEKLQQFFNHHMFVLEQSEYLREGISWNYVDFGQELKPTIELIEGSSSNKIGIFSLLNEECVVPKGSDTSFLEKLHRELHSKTNQKNPRYRPSKLRDGFVVQHYAGTVEYSVDGWLDKNKDPLSSTLVEILSGSKDKFVKGLFDSSIETNFTNSPVKGGQRRGGRFRTVAQRHKEQLNDLMKQLSATHPHFVRCILPNTNKMPGEFDKRLVLEQLRCNGVLEGIRIARSGYPNRIEFDQFAETYWLLAKNTVSSRNLRRRSKDICEIILNDLHLDPEVYKIGTTKLFFRNGVLAKLEKEKTRKLSAIVSQFNAVARGVILREKTRAQLAKMQASRIIAKNFTVYNTVSSDPWFRIVSQVKPLLADSDSSQSFFNQRIRSLEKKINALNAEKEMEAQTKNKLSEELASVTRAIEIDRKLLSDKTKNLETLQVNHVKLEKQLMDKETDIRELQDDCKASKTAFEQEKKQLLDQIGTLTGELEANSKDAHSLREQIESLRKLSVEKDERIRQLEAALESANADLEKKLKQKVCSNRRRDIENDVLYHFESSTNYFRPMNYSKAINSAKTY
ncbi:hypothetical protein KL921_000889 [Ogataea angusta]|nr:hypothetical protein KL921_000889 [Ogataea angusta]KAG7831927.1 hypothetical protein KL920_000262 [Ogataea angusta]KAG7863571.1 hypothetical protein KL919_000886 [Ogataea angusta]